jgi:hypothetical protein
MFDDNFSVMDIVFLFGWFAIAMAASNHFTSIAYTIKGAKLNHYGHIVCVETKQNREVIVTCTEKTGES